MDKISQLLQEARPLYMRRQREKYVVSGSVLAFCLMCVVWLAPVRFDEAEFDAYFTALYLNTDNSVTESFIDEVVPTDRYGLYEVS